MGGAAHRQHYGKNDVLSHSQEGTPSKVDRTPKSTKKQRRNSPVSPKKYEIEERDFKKRVCKEKPFTRPKLKKEMDRLLQNPCHFHGAVKFAGKGKKKSYHRCTRERNSGN